MLAIAALALSPVNLAQWTSSFAMPALAALLTWLLKSHIDIKKIQKLEAEVKKLDAENLKLKAEEVTLVGETMRDLQRCRESYSNACIACGQHAKKVHDLLAIATSTKDLQAVRSHRDNFSETLAQQVFPSLCSYIEWQILIRRNEPSLLVSYVFLDVIPELERLTNWIAIINHPTFVERWAPLQIQERTMRPFFDLMLHIPEDQHNEIKEPLYAWIHRVIGT